MSEEQKSVCPHCGHDKAWKNGHRNGCQRWLCKNCGREYVERRARGLSSTEHHSLLAVADEKQAERLVCVQNGTEKEEGELEKWRQLQKSDPLKDLPSDLQAKILAFAVKRENQGYKSTRNILYALQSLHNYGANLYDPENVKEILKKIPVGESTKKTYADNYEVFLKYLGGIWEKPKYQIAKKIPFIPLETEIDQLIAALSHTVSVFCQIAKETAARKGEIGKIRWIDIDFERRLIAINFPEKGCNPRVIKVSEKCINMIKSLPKDKETLFSNVRSISSHYHTQRERIANFLSNPRILKITLHTFRHWKATIEYHRTKDILYVKDFLGHKKIESTLIYVTIERTIFQDSSTDEFTVNVAKTVGEACKLITVGFDYVCEYGDAKIFRKRL